MRLLYNGEQTHNLRLPKKQEKELKKQNIIVTEDELWDYFSKNFWKKATNLSLSMMVDDILNVDHQGKVIVRMSVNPEIIFAEDTRSFNNKIINE